MGKSHTEREKASEWHAHNVYRITANGFGERPTDERTEAQGKDVERNWYESFGAADIELLHELKSCWTDDRSSDRAVFVNKTD